MPLATQPEPTDEELGAIARHAAAVRGRLDAMAQDVAAVKGIIDELASALGVTWEVDRARYPTTAAAGAQEPAGGATTTTTTISATGTTGLIAPDRAPAPTRSHLPRRRSKDRTP